MSDYYDVLVVGGGIQGAGVAQAAAAAGYSVLLLEKTEIAGATSSKSSKLIHGGLRYLETGQFKLVRECLREQAILLKIAPDLVKLVRFHIPIYKKTRRSCWHIRLGLGLYHALTGFRRNARPGLVKAQDWSKLDGIETDELKSVHYYADAQTDDKLLTQAVIQSARSLDAKVLVPATFVAAQVTDEGCDVNYTYEGENRNCRAGVVINAAGPWVNDIAKKISPTPPRQDIDLVAGTHIIVEGTVGSGIYYLEAPRDGRAVFVMPWFGKTMVGTTERTHRDLPHLVRPTQSEKVYLLNVLKHYFPSHKETTVADIVDAFSGLRVLPKGGKHAFHRSRDVIYKTYPERQPRVVSIYGGKLTAYRATALDVMKQVDAILPERQKRGNTATLPLTVPTEESPLMEKVKRAGSA